MSLPALEDINTHRLAEAGSTEPIEGLIRIETTSKEKATPIIMERMRSVYPHDQVFGEYCTVNDYIDCPPDELFDYLADTRSLEEWTYSLRGFAPTEEPGLWIAYDRLGARNEKQTGSPIFTRTVAHREARTVDYHCAWDQGKHLWMIYLMRVVDAQVVFDKPGLGGAVDELPPPVLRQEPLSGDRAAEAAGVGGRLLGHVRRRSPAGTEEPQGDRRVPPPQRTAGDPGLDEMSNA